MPINHPTQSSNLLEVLEKILDKGVVIAGDIKISLADVDLLTIKIRLLIASVDKAREIGMDWWEKDPYYSSRGRIAEEENARLYERINRLEHLVDAKALPLKVEERGLLESSAEKAYVHLEKGTALQQPIKRNELSKPLIEESLLKINDSEERRHPKLDVVKKKKRDKKHGKKKQSGRNNKKK